MLTIALCQTKGGAGKSTLAECLAVEAARSEMTYLVDMDPQQSTTKWWRRRKGPTNPMLVTNIQNVPAFMMSLHKKTAPDVVIFDTPGGLLGVIRDAVAVADVIIVPISPSIKDWEAMDAVESIIAKAGKRDRTLYVVNRFRKGTETSEEAKRALTERVANPPLTVGLRTDHERADAAGMTAPEINKDAAAEISSIWAMVRRIAADEQKAIRKAAAAS